MWGADMTGPGRETGADVRREFNEEGRKTGTELEGFGIAWLSAFPAFLLSSFILLVPYFK
jgi:hypothetical protein